MVCPQTGLEGLAVTGLGSPGEVTPLDPARLRRALSLNVEELDGSAFVVTGGSQPHKVHHTPNGWRCDCADARYHGGACKHRLAVYLARRLDKRVRDGLSVVVEAST